MAREWKWICEYCFCTRKDDVLPATWAMLIGGCAACPACFERMVADGGINVVKGGAYADGPDPRGLTTMKHTPVESSNIASIGYDARNKILEVQFTNASVYQYAKVPAPIYGSLMDARSKGSFLNAFVKPKYACTKIEARSESHE